MNLDIVPKQERGHFVAVLSISVKDGILNGEYVSNSMLPDGGTLGGNWMAHRLGEGESITNPTICHGGVLTRW